MASRSRCGRATALAWSGPTAAARPRCCGSWPARRRPTPATCQLHPAAHLGYLEQQPRFDADRTLHDEARSALADLVALQQEALEVSADIAEAADPVEQKRLAARYDHLQHELHRQDAYNIDHRIGRVLDGLRFGRESLDQPVASLSGGEQNRLMLAKLLLAEPNLMILDEPSNHLDIDATEWLEEFLLESSAAMIVVSHDRYFLDKVTNRTLELFCGTVDGYTGNFSAYWQQKAERLLVERRTYEKQQIEIEKTKDFIRRNAYGQKHAQAEDRRKKLERIEAVAPPREIAAPAMRFPPAQRSGDIVVRAEGVAKAYDRPLVPRRFLGPRPRPALGPAGAQRLRQDDAAAVPAGPHTARRGRDQPCPGRDGRVLRSATGRVGRRNGSGRRRSAEAQADEPAAAARSAGGLRAHRPTGAAEGRQPQRRRAVPRGLGAAGRRGRQLPGARRAHQPPRPLGPRRLGNGADPASMGPCCLSATTDTSSTAWPTTC